MKIGWKIMHLSIVSPTLLPPDIGASLPGLVSQICDPGVRHFNKVWQSNLWPRGASFNKVCRSKIWLRGRSWYVTCLWQKTVRNYSAHLPLQSFAVRTRTHVIEHACPLHCACPMAMEWIMMDICMACIRSWRRRWRKSVFTIGRLEIICNSPDACTHVNGTVRLEFKIIKKKNQQRINARDTIIPRSCKNCMEPS